MMVAIDENIKDDQEYRIVGKMAKAHGRQIIGVWSFQASTGQIGVITIAHDSLKLWRINEMEDGSVTFTERSEVKKWRCGVQSADVSNDGKCMCVLGVDSILHEIILGETGPVVLSHDFGYMEAWHIRIAKNKLNYMTISYSGTLTEIDQNGKISRQEPFNNVKHVSSIAYSNDSRHLAVANNEGVVQILDMSTLKPVNTFEIHAMKIRVLVFVPRDDHILTGSDDKTMKLHSLAGERPMVVRMFCGNKSPVMCVAFDNRSNGTRFASSNQGGQIFIWNIEQTVALCQLPSIHDSMVSSVVFTSTGRHLVSVGDDRQIICFRIPQSGRPSPLQNYDDELIDDSLKQESEAHDFFPSYDQEMET